MSYNSSFDFNRALSREIPLSVTASFFHRLKTAGWGDPPDETGMLEGSFAAPLEQVLAKLLEVTAAKFKKMVAYHVYAESMRGVAQHGVSEVFHEHAEQERAAAEAYLKRAAVLGSGPVHLPEIETPPASSDPVGILMLMARAEQEGIAAQAELKAMVGDANPLAFQIEAFMVEDQHHLDELWQMMPQDQVRTPLLDQAAAGAMPPAPPPEAAPVETKEPTPQQKEAFARAVQSLQKYAGDLIELFPNGSPKPQVDPKSLLGGSPIPQGPPGDLIPFPGKGERMMRTVKKTIGGAADAVGEKLQRLPVTSKAMLGGGAYGAAMGGIGGALSGASRSPEEEAELAEGGPISRFSLDHPALAGAAMGGASVAGAVGGIMAGGNSKYPILAIPGGLAGLMAPRIAAQVADHALKGREEEKLSHAFRSALQKLGYAGPTEPGMGTDPGTAPMGNNEQMTTPMPTMQQPGPQPPMAQPPGSQQFAPMNYLEAEETARRAQGENEAAFYRGQAADAQTQVQGAQVQLQESQAQLEQMQAQAAETQSQIMQANQEAVQANDQMLNQATLAARMRMGMQQLRAQMMEVASQDPEQLAAAAGGPTPMDVGMQAQQAQAGAAPMADPAMGGEAVMTGDPNAAAGPTTPEGAPPAGASSPEAGGGGEAPPEGGSGSGDGSKPPEKKDSGETTVSIKKGSVADTMRTEVKRTLPWMVAGGALGGGKAYLDAKNGKGIDALRGQVDELKGQEPEGGFSKTLELAKTQLALGAAEDRRNNPGRAALSGALGGAGMAGSLAMAVPAAISGGKQLLQNYKSLRSI